MDTIHPDHSNNESVQERTQPSDEPSDIESEDDDSLDLGWRPRQTAPGIVNGQWDPDAADLARRVRNYRAWETRESQPREARVWFRRLFHRIWFPEFLPLTLDKQEDPREFQSRHALFDAELGLTLLWLFVSPNFYLYEPLLGEDVNIRQLIYRPAGIFLITMIFATWAFGYINPDFWTDHIPFGWECSAYFAHLMTACARLSCCITYFLALWSTTARVRYWSAETTLYIWWYSGMTFLSLLHVAFALLRYHNSNSRTGTLLSQAYTTHPNADIDPDLRLVKRLRRIPIMKVLSSEERKCQQEDAQREMASTRFKPSPEACRHRQTTFLDFESYTALALTPSTLWQQVYRQGKNVFFTPASVRLPFDPPVHPRFNSKLFARCHCCPDSHPKARRADNDHIPQSQDSDWDARRDLFMRFPKRYHSIYGAYPQGPDPKILQDNDIELHSLCQKCETFCKTSRLLDLLCNLTPRRYRDYLTSSLSTTPLTEELFEHWPTFSRLSVEAQKGCHLCSIICDSLSPDQQADLLQHEDDDTTQSGNLPDQGVLCSLSCCPLRLLRARNIRTAAFSSSLISVMLGCPDLGCRNGGHNERRHWARTPQAVGMENMWTPSRLGRAVSMNRTLKLWFGLTILQELLNQGPIQLCMQRSTDSSSSIDLIRTWLKTHAHHDTPGDDFEASSDSVSSTKSTTRTRHNVDWTAPANWPSRLLYLHGGNEELGRRRVRVVPQGDFRSSAKYYAALSYCWRQNEKCKLTERMGNRSEIWEASLAPTLRDAISISRKLGLQYLWVDALCIKQDSDADKSREIPKMASIYSNAKVVISATAAWDSSESFIAKQNDLAMNPCLVNVSGSTEQLKSRVPDSFGGVYALPSRRFTDYAANDLELSRLASRGWVYQEEQLSRRIVFFTTSQIVMQCNICNTRMKQADYEGCLPWSQQKFVDLVRPDIVSVLWRLFRDTYWTQVRSSIRRFDAVKYEQELDVERRLTPNEIDLGYLEQLERSLRVGYPSFDQDTTMSEEIVAKTSFSSLAGKTPSEIQRQVWWEFVTAYSQRYLSLEDDKLPAIEGLATRIVKHLESHGTLRITYFQGHLISSEFTPSLLWYVAGGKTSRPERRTNSWSWASVNGTVKNVSHSARPDAPSTGVTILNDPSQTGGRLRIRATLRLAAWCKITTGPPRYYKNSPSDGHGIIRHARDLHMSHPLSSDPTAGPLVHGLYDIQGRKVGFFVPDTNEELPEALDGKVTPPDQGFGYIWCLKLSVVPRGKAAREDIAIPWLTRGLALIQTDARKDEFRRVGYIEIHQEPGELRFSSSFSFRGKKTLRRPPDLDPRFFFVRDPGQTLVEKDVAIV